MANPFRLNQAIFSMTSVAMKFLALSSVAVTLSLTASAQAPVQRLLSRHVPLAVGASRALHPLDRTRQLHLAIGLPLRNQAALDEFLSEVSDPNSPNYHHYLTPEQFTEKFGPTQASYDAVVSYAQAKGLTVTKTHANRMVVDVAGAAPQVERAFHVNLITYRNAARGDFYAPDREPALDLNVTVQHITGLDNFAVPRPMDIKAASETAAPQALTGSGPSGYLIGNDFRAAYAPGVVETGTGQTVALVEFDGFYANDVAKNFAKAGVTPVPVQTVLVDGFNGAPGYANDEVTLDIMMTAYMAPGLSKIMSYEGYFPDDILNQIAVDNKAKQISCSWTFGIDSTTEQIFKQFVAQGQTFLQAAGDSGAYKNGVDSPADDPNITSVGGTHLTTAGASGPWSNETVWSSGGGGVSTLYPIPSYQQGTSVSASGFSKTMRNIPDVALTADVQIYLIYNNGSGGGIGGTSAAAPLWAGFIALANQRAAANGAPPVGFLNPTIYAIGNSGNYSSDFNDIKTGSNGYSAATGFDLATGWGSPAGDHLIADLTKTEGGSFTIANTPSSVSILPGGTANANVSVTPSGGFSGNVSFQISGLPTGITASFGSTSSATGSSVVLTANSTVLGGTYTATVTGVSGTVSSTAKLTITVPQPNFTLSSSASGLTAQVGGAAVSTNVVIAGSNGFNGTVNLTASGLPPGVMASFSPASTASASLLTLTPTGSAVPGTYTIGITGTSGSLSASTTVVLNVPSPSLSVWSADSSLTLFVAGARTPTTVYVAKPAGVTGNVNLTLSGVPPGVTTGMNAPSTSTSTILAFYPSASTVPGTYTVTVTGTLGSSKTSTGIQITVPKPSFGLTSNVSGMSLLVGGTGAAAIISVANPVGLAKNVDLTLSGVPAGVASYLATPSTSTTCELDLRATTTAVPGTYTITINGSSIGGSTASTTLQLVIPNPSFTLSAGSTSLAKNLVGSTASSIIKVAGQNGFRGTVNLALSGVPAGITATLGSPSTSSSSTLYFKQTGSVASGTYEVMVTGTSGSLKATQVVPITIP